MRVTLLICFIIAFIFINTGYSEDGKCISGDWKNGKTDGSSYAGEWRNGVPDGKGRYTYHDGTVYDGEWKKGRRDGNGIEYAANGLVIYRGRWKDDMPAE